MRYEYPKIAQRHDRGIGHKNSREQAEQVRQYQTHGDRPVITARNLSRES